jgi:hypothetical protein
MTSILFKRQTEPNEAAFTVLVPQGWQIRGGIFRENLMNTLVSAQNIEAKLDFAVLRDAQGLVMSRSCPEIKYCDPRMSTAGAMGFFPPGSNYSGMIVWPLLSAANFLTQMFFPWAHPQATQPQVVERQPLDDVRQRYDTQLAGLGIRGFSNNAELLVYTYTENGVRYKERASTCISCLGPLAAGMWSNKDLSYMRAPEAEFDQWLPVLLTIQHSAIISPTWLEGELRRQGMLTQAYQMRQQAEQDRAKKALEIQRYLQDADREINEHHAQTQAEIRNDAYLNMTNQEEYKNPYTGDTDLGSNQWNHRWVNPNGDVFYCDSESDDPNHIDGINMQEWQRSKPRPRRPYD